MTETVLFAYDGSVGARHAIQRTAELLGPGYRAVVLYVQPPVVRATAAVAGPGVPVYPHGTRDQEEEMDQHAEQLRREGCSVAVDAGFTAHAQGARAAGPTAVAEAIIDAGEEHDVALIAVGGSGRSRLLAALLGSVGDTLVHRSSRPVLVVPVDEVDAGT